MAVLVIEGSKRLEGELNIQGAKNSVLPILAASIMCDDECIIHNCPKITDVDVTTKILRHLGCKVDFNDSTIIVDSKNLVKSNIPDYLMREMRSSIIFLGAIISKLGKARLCLPGGCELGPRPIDLHLDGLRQLGLIVDESHGFMECNVGKGLTGCNIALSFPSVGATENLILAAVKATGTTIITNAAREPEIYDLVNFLNKCGAKIRAGQGTLIIEGVEKLHGCEYNIISDRIVAITYMAATAITGGKLIVRNVYYKHIDSAIPIFEESGCVVEIVDNSTIKLEAPARLHSNKIVRTMPYPGFPTDAQAPIMAMSTMADGTSVFVENIFESRFKHIGELLRLGADIKVEGKVAIIEGVKHLSGANLSAMDLRGGAALIIAGLGADGITKVSNLGYVDRGYENIEKNLCEIGAVVKRI